uniref:Tubulin-specific chaperone A n=1 Tax=Syphacia muris TaxID=451379 RepID=A0A0N5ACZ8_9BILA
MSGGIRQNIAPIVKRPQDYLREIPKLPTTEDEATTSKNYDDNLREARTHLNQLKHALTTLKGEELKKEQAAYDAMADDTKVLTNIVERASEGIGYLEADIAEAERAASRKHNRKSNSCERELNITNSRPIRNENERTLDPS